MEKDANWLLKEKYHGLQTSEYLADVERLKAGEPLAYIIGNIPFLNCTIHLDSKPLIPRAETEFWVEITISSIRTRQQAVLNPVLAQSTIAAGDSEHPTDSPEREQSLETESLGREWKDFAPARLNILDLCAGSGCIGVAVANAIPEAHITFGEIDAAHVATIVKNCAVNDINKERYDVITSDLFSDIIGTFDFILTNPPYIDPALDRTTPSVKAHEPHLALYGGRDGVELIEKIIAAAPAHLNQGGTLWIEHEPEQEEVIHSLAEQYGFLFSAKSDQYGVIRYSVLYKR